jgi:hypothetical protein
METVMSQSLFWIAEKMPGDFSEIIKRVEYLRLPISVQLLSSGPIFGNDDPISLQAGEKQDRCEKYSFEYPYADSDFLAELSKQRLGTKPSQAVQFVFSSGFNLFYGLMALSIGFVESCGGFCYYDSVDSEFLDRVSLRRNLKQAEMAIKAGY